VYIISRLCLETPSSFFFFLFLLKGSLRNAGKLDEDRGPPKKIAASESKKKAGATSGVTSSYLNYSGAVSQFSSSFPSDEKLPDAASEKELVGDVDI